MYSFIVLVTEFYTIHNEHAYAAKRKQPWYLVVIIFYLQWRILKSCLLWVKRSGKDGRKGLTSKLGNLEYETPP